MSEKHDQSWKQKATIFILSQTISILGSSIVGFVIVWYITLETSSGTLMTLSILSTFLPSIVISPIAGVWADRYNRKRLIIYADVFIGISTLILALFFLSGVKSMTLIFVASAIRSIGSGVQIPAVSAILPQFVPPEHLTRVNGINSSIQSAMLLISPTLGGVLLATLGFSYSLLFDVVTAAIAVGVMSFLVIQAPARSGEMGSPWEELNNGIRYVRSHPLISRLLIFYAAFFFLITPAAFLTPLMVERSFGPDVWRLTANELSWTAGSLIGGVLVSLKGNFKNKIRAIAISSLAFGVTFALLGVAGNFWIYLAIMLVSGIFMPVFATAETVLFQEHVEEAMMGRVFSLVSILISLSMPLGMVVFGPLADVVSIESLMIASGVALALLAGVIISNQKLIQMDER